MGLGCVVLAYGRECLVLRREARRFSCAGRELVLFGGGLFGGDGIFSLIGHVGVVQGLRDVLSLACGRIGAGDRPEFSGLLGGSQLPS